MRSAVLVSIIMRTYNRAHLLPRAVRSVREQTLTDWELIIVDDCSTDLTQNTLNLFRVQDSRIKVLSRPRNSRFVEPRVEPMNDGLKLARGGFIAYLDDDNQWEPSYLEELTGVLQNHPDIALAYCDTKDFVRSAIQEQEGDERQSYLVSPDAIVFPHEPVFRGYQLFSSGRGYRDYIDTNEMVHTREALLEIGGSWPLQHPRMDEINRVQGNSYRTHNDLALVESILARYGSAALCYLPRPLAIFIDRSHRLYNDGAADLRERNAQSLEGRRA